MAWSNLVSGDVDNKTEILAALDLQLTEVRTQIAKFNTMAAHGNLPPNIVGEMMTPLNFLLANLTVIRAGVNANVT